MKLAVLGRVLPHPWLTIVPVHLHLVVLIPYRLLMSLLTVILGLLVLARSQPVPDPFAAYLSLVQGNAGKNAALQEIPCWTTELFSSATCARFREPDPFSMIHLTFDGEGMESVRFVPHEGSLRVGDLVLLWGRPKIEFASQAAVLSWLSPEVRAIAIASPDCGGDIYFAPVVHVAFSGFIADRRRSPY